MIGIIYGNGKSRQKWNVNQKLDNVITWGCNRIYNDVKVDNLVSVDYAMQHEIYKSGYAHKNKCLFSNWSILPSSFDVGHLKNSGLNVIENDNTNKNGFVVNGKHTEPYKGLYITWVDDEDMVEDIDFPREWSTGTTAVHLACQQGIKEIYLMGFDLSENPLNNVYEDYQKTLKVHKGIKDSDPHFYHRSDWEREIKTIFNEFREVDFIWIEPHERAMKFNYNNLTYDTYENIRRKICR